MYLIYKVLITKSSFTNQSDIDEIRTTVTLSLSQIVGKYIHYIKIHRGGDDAEIPSFRMNIMLLTQGGLLRKNYMKMYFYSSFPDDLLYSERELQMKWYRGKGACGISWKTGRHVVYDSVDPNLKDPINSLTKKQKELFNGNQSILSIPLWSKFRENKRVFAILNLDSNHKADLTLIKNAGIIRGLSNEIVLLSYVLSDFHNGVLDDE
ncbi:hypothetical protein QMM61_17390 [Leptospira santarosai]|nr:hypothetical protein [Leptospira santarosai]MDI7198439.1 hypothetical protein [Leptospira santarosai]